MKRYVKHDWEPGELITESKVDAIETGVEELSSEVREAAASETNSLGYRLDNMIKVSNTQPVSSTNDIWIIENGSEEIIIPTYDELLTIMKDFADVFDQAQAYTAGNYAFHESLLYRAKVDLAAGTMWRPENWEQVVLTNELIATDDHVKKYIDAVLEEYQPYSLQFVTESELKSANFKGQEFTFYLVAKNDGKKYDKYWYIKDEKGNYKIDNWGGSSTIVVTELPTSDIDPDTDYIVNDSNGCRYYKRINGQWKLIAGTNVEFVNSLPATGNIFTDYYLSVGNNTYQHYRWYNDAWRTIGIDAYTKNEVNALFNSYYNKDEINTKINEVNSAINTLTTNDNNQNSKIAALQTLSDKINNNNFVTGVTTDDNDDLEVTYLSGRSDTITLEGGGLAFDSGKCVYDEEKQKYYLHLTSGGQDLPTDVFTPFVIEGAGGGGGTTSYITLTNVTYPRRVNNGDEATISFTATTSDNTDITIVWSVNGVTISDMAAISPSSGVGISGDTFSFNTQEYLNPSNTNTITCTMTSGGDGFLSRSFTIRTIEYSLNWFDSTPAIQLETTGQPVQANLIVQQNISYTSTVFIKVNNNSPISQIVTGSNNLSVSLPANLFTIGANTVTAYMVNNADATNQTVPISYTVLWAYQSTDPLVAFADTSIEVDQYDIAPIRYYVYDPNNEIAEATLTLPDVNDAEKQSTISIQVDRSIQTYSYRPQFTMTNDTETLSASLSINENIKTLIEIVVRKSKYNLARVKSGNNLPYELDPAGHSNNDVNRLDFGSNGDDKTIFSENFDWTSGGFQEDEFGCPAFVVKKGSYIQLPRTLFQDSESSGKTIDISFKITNSEKYDAIAMQDLNNAKNYGLVLKANEGILHFSNSQGYTFKYCEETRVDMSILVEPTSITTNRIFTLWMDGIPSYVAAMGLGQTFTFTNNNTRIGSNECDIWIYTIRCYNTALSEQEMVQNYIANGPTIVEKINRSIFNDIYDSGRQITSWQTQQRITPESLHAAAPNLTIVTIEAERMSESKSDPVVGDIKIIDGENILELPHATSINSKDGCIFKVQGTSSTAYATSSLNLDIDFTTVKNTDGSVKTYKLSQNSIPVSYLNIKVNVASSENANNVCAVDWYNSNQPWLIQARQQNSSVRDTVEGKPCAVFFKTTQTNEIEISSQKVKAEDGFILYAMGDLCNSKKNTTVFGQNNIIPVEHPTKACIEVSGNDDDCHRFVSAEAKYVKAKGEWQVTRINEVTNLPEQTKCFEWRMEPSSEELETVVKCWDDTVAWCVSTINDSDKFFNEFANYFHVQPMLYHYLMIEYFAAYDDVCKNTFYSFDWDENADQSIWGGYRWSINKAYDWDTILAYDNDGYPKGDYGIDYNTLVPGDEKEGASYYFNDKNTCPIWQNIKKAFKDSLNTLYVDLRAMGTWNSDIIADKWNNYQAQRPTACMVRDAYVKYIYPYKYRNDGGYLLRMAGNKVYQRKQFLTYQTSYMDGKYGYANKSTAINLRSNYNNTYDLTLQSYATTYLCYINDQNQLRTEKCNKGDTIVFSNIRFGANTTLYFGPEKLIQFIKPLNTIGISTFSAGGAVKLTDATLGGDTTNGAWPSGQGIRIPSPVLKYFNIRNLSRYDQPVDLQQNLALETVDTRGTLAGSVILPEYAPLTSIQLNACSALIAKNLNKIIEFSLESGNNLMDVNIENCNTIVQEKMATYLLQSYESGNIGDRHIRLTGIDWTLRDGTLLDYLLTAKAIDAQGNAVDDDNMHCVLTGKVYIETLYSLQLEKYKAAWGDALEITYKNFFYQYEVKFVNDDENETELYSTVVAGGELAADPVANNLIPTPTKESSEQYSYTYTGWRTSVPGIDITSPIQGNTVFIATYTETLRKYTVKWYLNRNSDPDKPLVTASEVSYGSELIYEDLAAEEGLAALPTDTQYEPSGIYRLFTGWDKSTGYVRGDMNVYGQWLEHNGNLTDTELNTSTNLGDLTPIQLYTLSRMSSTARKNLLGHWDDSGNYFEDHLMDYIDVTFNNDLDFSQGNMVGNIQQNLLAEDYLLDGTLSKAKVFDGFNGNPRITMQSLVKEGWTLAIDFKFDHNVAGTLFSCGFDDSNNFKLMVSSNGARFSVNGASLSYAVGNLHARQILVIRHAPNSTNVSVYSSTGYASVNSRIIPEQIYVPPALAFNRNLENAGYLVFGGQLNADNSITQLCEGVVHWAKFWYDDLGPYNCKTLASYPHETVRFWNERQNLLNYDSEKNPEKPTKVSMSFWATNILSRTALINSQNTSVGGWASSTLNKDILNKRLFKALPIWLQGIIVPTEIIGVDCTQKLYTDKCYLYIPSYREMVSTTVSILLQEADNQIYWTTSNAITSPQTYTSPSGSAENLLKAKWRMYAPGATIPPNTARYIYHSQNPYYIEDFQPLHTGDIWINSGDTARLVKGFYISEDDLKMNPVYYNLPISTGNFYQCLDTNGQRDGGWLLSISWWTRSAYYSNQAITTNFQSFNLYGNATHVNSAAGYCGILLGFSIGIDKQND